MKLIKTYKVTYLNANTLVSVNYRISLQCGCSIKYCQTWPYRAHNNEIGYNKLCYRELGHNDLCCNEHNYAELCYSDLTQKNTML